MEFRHSSPDVPNIDEITALDPSLEKSKEVVHISSPELLNTTSSGAKLGPSNGGNLELSSDTMEPKEKPHNPSLESSQNIDLVSTPLADSIVTDERNMTLRSPEETTGTKKTKLPDKIQKPAVSDTSTGHDLVIQAPILPTDENSQAPDSPDVPVILQVNNSTSNSSRLESPRLDSNDESSAPHLTEAGEHIGNHLDEIVISDSTQTNVKIEDDPCISLTCLSSNVPFVSLDNSSAVLNSNTAKGNCSPR
ncbi:hypothetical protein GALMADRAFT_1180101 [Galerina marginata CBS 339.88]|uniref:Uncharacterized protein n=1 Tax=Galerina marginata (strain CBS 339.88) TaxID=685588 RepID=A0A067TJM5_GALM3|nr:hypothetical protein GALMADRAFT_1180101 [Galerina marginata CBS 339.88]